MMRFFLILAAVTAMACNSADGWSQDFYVYPRGGQDSQTMEKDKYDCYQWARQQTGFDPSSGSGSYAAQGDPYAPSGDIARGAARGALAGAVVGGIASDDAGRGAAIGAASGGMIGGMKRRDRMRSNQARQQQYQQSNEQHRQSYNRAYAACLDARDYSVK